MTELHENSSRSELEYHPKIIFMMDGLLGRDLAFEMLYEYAKEYDVKFTLGLIGISLEFEDTLYEKWILTLLNTSYFQLWNHGYTHQCPFEFQGISLAKQEESIRKTQEIAREKLGITLTAFGAPENAIDGNTLKALEKFPEIECWFYGNPESSKIVFPKVLELEQPLGRVNFEHLRTSYNGLKGKSELFVLQGHPTMWEKPDWINFKAILKFLKYQKCTFIFPDEYSLYDCKAYINNAK